MSDADDLERWLSVGDLDELLREIDRRCDRGDWDGVEEIRRRSRSAIERGHQLWPAASFAEYRLALQAPAEHAAAVVTDEAGWMAPGPIAEVVAQDHTWAELAPLLEVSARRAVVAQERVVRGEHVDGTEDDIGELPGRLLAWEPGYAVARYTPDGMLEAPPPPPVPLGHDAVSLPEAEPGGTALPATGSASDDAQDGARALRGALEHWATRSDGRVASVGVDGGVLDALGALGLPRARVRECSVADALALLAWGAADGAAHGRRRGAAAGRHDAWWCASVLAGVEDDWPVDPGPELDRLRWCLWLPEGTVTGWSCRLAVEDPDDGLAWALDAHELSSTAPS